jgi:[glutamine synthetase] adenylyltransferase / [glutamine synthetase]-adenylyl-L-tyrosine phosphorylase
VNPASFIDGAIDWTAAELALDRLREHWPADLPKLDELIGHSEGFAGALGHLLSISPISTDKLIADPEALVWLANPEIYETPRGPRRMRAHYEELRGSSHVFDERFVALRRCKARELLRIAIREVANWSPVEQTTLELTLLAELCVRSVASEWLAQLVRRWGDPGTEFAIIGMGKFGGQELNYSSDIDVVFIYGEDGDAKPGFTRGEFFTRLAEKIIGVFSSKDSSGSLFRIDLRLRPEGNGGPLVRSLDSTENYYAAFGETWERMALIKARVVGGCGGADELGYELFQRLQSFIYPRSVSPEMLEEVSTIKGRIEREILGADGLKRNVKLGYGGIREIEFVAQTLQLLHGAQHAFLQERSTLKALRGLRELGFIPYQDMETLIEAYHFLRTVEHRLQIEAEAQTHTLPDQPAAFARLERSLSSVLGPGASLAEQLRRTTTEVRAIFDRVLRSGDDGEPEMDLSIFHDAKRARQLIEGLAQGDRSPRTRKIFYRLEPVLIDWLRRIADPDQTLTHFFSFVERYGARSLLYETLLQNPRLLELLVRLFDSSRFLSEIVIRRPQLIEEVARSGGLGHTKSCTDYLADLGAREERLSWQDWLRVFRRAQLVRIALRDLLGFGTLEQIQAEYTSLAESCLVFAQRELHLTDRLTVIAMGKFAGRELGYGSDLDVQFIGDDSGGAATLMRSLSEMTSEGRAFEIDARLRPEGNAGPLACSLSTFVEYFEGGRGQFWEAQALTKSRPISGSQQDEWLAAAQLVWRRFGDRPELAREVAGMHERVVKERTRGEDYRDFKTGSGGLMQAEFFAQAHQMRSGIWEPGTRAAFEKLGRASVIPGSTAEALISAYHTLRRIEGVLRRVDDSAVSKLPADETETARLARRAGYPSMDAFREDYQRARETIREKADF